MMNAPEQAAVALGRGLDTAEEPVDPAELGRGRILLARCLLRTGRPAEATGGAWQVVSRGRDARRGITPAARPVRPPGAQAPFRRRPRHDPGMTTRCLRSRRSRPPTSARRDARSAIGPFTIPRSGAGTARTFLRDQEIASLAFLPAQPVADPADSKVTHRYHKASDHVEVETRIDDRIVRTIVDYAFGSGDRGMTLVGHNERNHLFESRLSYYSNSGGWDVTSGQSSHPDQRCLVSGLAAQPGCGRAGASSATRPIPWPS